MTISTFFKGRGRVISRLDTRAIWRVTVEALTRAPLITAIAMALRALLNSVRTSQRKTCHGMVKERTLPKALTVAVTTIRQCTPVNIVLLMAKNAVLAKPA